MRKYFLIFILFLVIGSFLGFELTGNAQTQEKTDRIWGGHDQNTIQAIPGLGAEDPGEKFSKFIKVFVGFLAAIVIVIIIFGIRSLTDKTDKNQFLIVLIAVNIIGVIWFWMSPDTYCIDDPASEKIKIILYFNIMLFALFGIYLRKKNNKFVMWPFIVFLIISIMALALIANTTLFGVLGECM